MKITCESCGAKYTIADDKVVGRKVKIRCKGCGTPIVVDGQKAADASDAAAHASNASGNAEGAQRDTEWSVNLSDTDQRTMSTQELVDGWKSGAITADAYVWKEGMPDWVPILECAELAMLIGSGPHPASEAAEASVVSSADAPATAAASSPSPFAFSGEPSDAATPSPGANGTPAPNPAGEARLSTGGDVPASGRTSRSPARAITPAHQRAAAKQEGGARAAARVAGARAQGNDLFAGVESAGAEVDIPVSLPSLPQAGSTPYDDRPTGARNENSVLFSLDALKAAQSSNPAPRPERTLNDDPFGMSSGIAGLGGGNPLFTLADNQRLISAPPPPEPPPRPVEAVASAPPPGTVALSKKALLGILGGGLALVLLVGVSIGAALGGDDGKEATAAAAEGAEKADKGEAADAADKKEEETKAAAPAEAEKAEAPSSEKSEESGEAAATEDAKERDEKADDDKDDKKTASEKKVSSSKRETKKVTSKSTKEAEPKATQPFNRNAAVAALSNAANQARSCKKPGGPTGTGKVTLTFANSGRVTSAVVSDPPFAGTSVGGCVASVFRKAKVPPFTGNPVRVSKSFTVK
ncbi:MAG: zinc-ribbon domain-containing protein [Pseudomonadota bacterium]